MGEIIARHLRCISEECGSSDALALYEDEIDGEVFYNATCYSCEGYFGHKRLASSYLAEEYGISGSGSSRQPSGGRVKPKKYITDEQLQHIKNTSKVDTTKYRTLAKGVNSRYEVLSEYNSEGGLIKRYYPTYDQEDKLCGYKIRVVATKDFYSVGHTGSDTQLFGQHNMKSGGKWVGIFGGEEDAQAAYEMLATSQHKRGYEPIPCVSPSTSETASIKNIQLNYEWLDTFEKIIIGFDDDKKGEEYAVKAAEVCPPGKVYLMRMPVPKDPCDVKKVGKDTEFVREFFFNAVKYKPQGIVGSSELEQAVLNELFVEKIPLPPFMSKLQKMTAGGLPLGYIVNIGAASGCVDADTEYLSPTGWVRISDYDGGEVAQYNNGLCEFVKPTEYIKQPCEKMTHIKARNVDQVLSDEHMVAYYASSLSKKLRLKPMYEVREKFETNISGWKGSFETAFSYSGCGVDFTEGELRLQVAVMADGRIVKEGKDNYTQMRFKKERKYLRLLEMCKKYNLRCSDRGINNQGQYEVIVWPKTRDKFFDEKYYNCSKSQFEIIVDEFLHWDGCVETKRYTSTNKSDVDFLQFALASIGVRTSIHLDKRVDKYEGGYCATLIIAGNNRVHLVKAGRHPTGATMEDFVPKDGMKYCFSVDSGMLILRRNNKIFITSNCGKTSIINEMIYYWLFNSPHKVGVVSLELSKGQYGIAMLSRHLGKKLQLFSNPEEAKAFVTSPENQAKAETLWKDETGDSRWYLVDEREGSIENLKKQIKQLVISCGCKVVVLDPLQDVLDSSTNEEQADFMKFQKAMLKHGITFVNINHVRKSGSGEKAGSQGRDLVEEDFAGSSTIFKSGGINLLCMRDKYAEDMITRNTTRVVLSKCRTTGMTGPAGEWYYDIDTHSLHDKDTFFASNTIEASVPSYEGERDLLDCAVIGATNDDIMESFGDKI